jgi:hypothetical protein
MTSQTLCRLLLLVVSLCSFVLPMVAQGGSRYTASYDYFPSDNQAACVLGKKNCFTQQLGLVRQMSIGIDDTVYGVNTSNTVFTLVHTTPTARANWTASTLPGGVAQVAVFDANNVYALKPDTWCSVTKGTGAYGVVKANPARTAWVNLSIYYCADNIAVGRDGTLVITQTLNGGSKGLYLAPGANAWVGFGTGWKGPITDFDRETAWGIGTDSKIYHIDLPTAARVAFDGALTQLSVTKDDQVLWGVNSAGQVFSRNMSNGGVNGWIAYQAGPMTGIAVGRRQTVFTINSSNVPFHYNNYAINVAVTTKGNYDCSTFGTGVCPPNSIHTVLASAAFSSGGQHGTAGITVTSTGTPAQNLNASVVERNEGCDLIFGDPYSPTCQLQTKSNATCSVMGTLFSDPVAEPWPGQVPTSLKVVSATLIPNSSLSNCGPTDAGIVTAIQYQVLDQYTKPMSTANMEPQEKILNLVFNGMSGGDPHPNWGDIGPSGYPGTSKFTDVNGQFLDAPWGACAAFPFTETLTQEISILLNGVNYPVRISNWTTTASSPMHGTIQNLVDVSLTR